MFAGLIASLVLKTGWSSHAVKVGLIASAIVTLVLVFNVAKCAYDRSIISTHDSSRDATIANSTLGADRAADAAQANRTAAYQNSAAAIDAGVSNAVAAHPQQVKQPVGPASQAYYDNLPDPKGKKK